MENVVTSFSIDKDLLKQVKLQAIIEEKTQSEIIVKALERYLRNVGNQTKLEID